MSKDCIFCQFIKGEAPVHKIWEDEKHMAFLSIFPNTKGFSVVIPKKHYSSYAFELPDKVLTDLTLAAKKVGKLIDKAFPDVGRTAMVYEGFGVDHVHGKLIPLHGTADMEKWEPLQSTKRTFFEAYPGYVATFDYEREDDEKLKKIAEKIRKIEK